MKKLAAALALFATTNLALAATVAGLEEPNDLSKLKYKDSWNFRVSPHFWLPFVTAQMNLHGNRADISTPISDAWEQLDVSLGSEFEANRGLWTIALATDYVKVTDKDSVFSTAADSTYESTMTDAGLYYRLYPQITTKHPYPISAELFGGARVVTLHSTIRYLYNSFTPTVSDTTNLIVPLLGMRVIYDFCPNIHGVLTGAVGGFQVTHVSNTWSGSIGMRYDFWKNWEFDFGYRGFGINYSIQAVSMNSQIQGPEIGFAYKF